MQEVVTHTYCDIDFVESGERVEGRRITWQVNGKPWNLDVCQKHGLDITIVEIDLFVEKYGHPEGAKPKPPKKAPSTAGGQKTAAAAGAVAGSKVATARASRANEPGGEYMGGEAGGYVCLVEEDGVQCHGPVPTMKGLKLHQASKHGLKVKKDGP